MATATITSATTTPPTPPITSPPDGSAPDASTVATPTTEVNADSPALTMEDLLARVPSAALESPDAILTYVDMAQVWERMGLADATSEARLARLADLGSQESYVITPRLLGAGASVDAAIREVGFSLANIEREVAVDDAPTTIRIDEVVVNSDDIVAALRGDPTWSDAMTEVTSGDVTYFDWNGELGAEPQPDRRTALRPLGIGGQLQVLPLDAGGSLVVQTNEAETMESLLAPGFAGVGATEPFARMFTALAPNTVVQALVTRHHVSFDEMVGARAMEAAEADSARAATVLIEPYEAVLVAEVTDGTTTNVVLELAYDSPEAATAAAQTVSEFLAQPTTAGGTPMADVFPGATASAAGSLVQVVVPGAGRLRNVVRALLLGDILLTT